MDGIMMPPRMKTEVRLKQSTTMRCPNCGFCPGSGFFHRGRADSFNGNKPRHQTQTRLLGHLMGSQPKEPFGVLAGLRAEPQGDGLGAIAMVFAVEDLDGW